MRFLFLSLAVTAALLGQPEPPTAPKAPRPAKAPKVTEGMITPIAPAPMNAPRVAAHVDVGLGKMHPGIALDLNLGKFAPGAAFALQDSKDRAESEADREYERGLRAIEKRQWEAAVNHFHEIAAAGKYRADAALYWKALALGRLGKTQEAGAAFDTLTKSHAQSVWAQEGQKLRTELSSKQLSADEEEIKLTAMTSLMHSGSERAVPLLEKILERRSSPQLQERALQLLTQSNSTEARAVVARIAKGGTNPNLQVRAVRHLGSHASPENRQILGEVYKSTSEANLKKFVLRGYNSFGDRDAVFAVAKSDPDPVMRREAIHILGGMGAHAQLAELYGAESSVEIRGSIMRGMMVAGSASKLIEIAKGEKAPTLRQQAIQYLGGMHSPAAAEALAAMYQSGGDAELRRRILRSLAGQNNAKHLIDVAKSEQDPELRRHAVELLTRMRNPEATAYLMELLK
jgi:HEAT repeat protein